MATINPLKYATLSAAINKIKTPITFLTDLLYGAHVAETTEQIVLETWIRGRKMAPFVKINSEAVPIQGTSKTLAVVSAPNIRIRRDIKPHDLMFNRTPGNLIFASRQSQERGIAEHMAKELAPLRYDIDTTIEWMAAQTLTGKCTYTVDTNNFKGDSFEIDYQRPNIYTVDISTSNGAGGRAWDAADNTGVDILQDVKDAKRAGAAEGMIYTDALMDANTADLLQSHIKRNTGGIQNLMKTDSNIKVGSADFTSNYDKNFVLYIGTLGGIRFWEYNFAVSDYEGNSMPLIRPNYVEFVAPSSGDFKLHYGAIPDMDALNGKSWVGEIFTKSKVEFDPSTITVLAHSRPLPVPHKPEATYSLKVA